MKRVCLTVVYCVLLLGLVPAKAYAWWDFIEQLSGPGPFWGWDIEARLVCFNERIGEPEALAIVARKAGAAVEKSIVAGNASNAQAFLASMPNQKERLELPKKLLVPSELTLKAHNLIAQYQKCDTPACKEAVAQWQKVITALEDYAKVMDQPEPKAQYLIPPAVGVLLSACPLESVERQRAAFEVGFRFVEAKHEQRFANDKDVQLTTIEPAFMWRLIRNPERNFVDYGIGIGMYWFSSEGFQSHKGLFLEPVRLDLHAPTSWTNKHKWLGLVRFRAGLLVFPRGFEADVFAERPETARRIPRDMVPAFSIVLNAEQLLRK